MIFNIEQIFVYNILRMNFQTILYNLGIDLYSCSINIYIYTVYILADYKLRADWRNTVNP